MDFPYSKTFQSEVTTLEPFIALESDKKIWRHTLEGLAAVGYSK
jgi:hypothetical protein